MGSARYTKEHVNILCAYLELQHARTVGLLVWYWFIRGAVENVLYEVRSRALCVEYIKNFHPFYNVLRFGKVNVLEE